MAHYEVIYGKSQGANQSGAKGKPLGQRVMRIRAEQGREQQGEKEIYKPKARMNIHIHDGRR